MLQDGNETIVIFLLHVLVHPALFVTVTEYVPDEETVILHVVAPVFHE